MDEQHSSGGQTPGNSWLITAGIIALLLIAGGVWYIKSSHSSVMVPSQTTPVAQASSTPLMVATSAATATSGASASSSSEQSNVKEFTVTGSNYKFEPATLTVNKGDKVKITFKNSGGFHDFVLDAFNVKTKIIPAGSEDSVEFTADKTGAFQYYCSVANHRAMGMVGTLTVQ